MILLLSKSIVAFVVTIILTILVRKMAFKYNISAKPSPRSVHKNRTPLLGGIAIFIAFVISFLIIVLFADQQLQALIREISVFLIGGFLILLLGIYDDIKGANCYQKFSVQILAGIVVILFGYKISAIANPFGGQLILGVFSIPLTLFWIGGITHASNLIDGLDGRAAGISFGATCIMVFISLWFGNIASAFPGAILAGSLAAFLIFNFNPAKIFLGDSGSLTLGFMLACFSINGTFRDSSAVAILIPIIVLGIPITDTLLAIVRRLRKGVHPFIADKEHIHHRLLYLGLSHKKVVLLMNAVSYTWGAIGVIIFISASRYSLALLLLIFVTMIWGIKKMGFMQYFLIRNKNQLKSNR